MEEGWVGYRRRGGSSGCSPLGSGLLCVGCTETDQRLRIIHGAQLVFLSNAHRDVLLSAPHPWRENLGRTDRPSIKRSVCVRAWAAPKLAWIPAPLQPLKMLELLIGVSPLQRPQSPASCSHHLFSLPPACAALFSCCCVRISSVKHRAVSSWEPGASGCIYFLFSSPSKDNGISLGPKSLLG